MLGISDRENLKDNLDETSELHEKYRIEQLYNSVINSQNNYVIRTNACGEYVFANPLYITICGYRENEIIGKHFLDTVLPDDVKLCEQAFNDAVNHPGQIIHVSPRNIDVQGNIHWIKWELTAFNDPICGSMEVQGIGHEVAPSPDIKQQAESAAAQLDIFIESITDSFFILDKEWKFKRVNQAFEKTTGKERAEVLGRVIWDVYPHLYDSLIGKAYQQAVVEQARVQYSEYHETLKIWVNIIAYPSPEGLTVIARDISNEMTAKEESLWAKNNIEALINNTADLIWSVDTSGRYVNMNNAYKAKINSVMGHLPLEGETAYEHWGHEAEVIEKWKAYYSDALQGRKLVTKHQSIHPVSKQVQHYEISFNPIYKAQDEIIGVGCFARDFTERVEHEKAIVMQNQRLRHISQLSSHELRRPVASMLGLISLIDQDNFSNPENNQIITHLLTVAQEIDEVIRLIVNQTFIDVP